MYRSYRINRTIAGPAASSLLADVVELKNGVVVYLPVCQLRFVFGIVTHPPICE